jgi:Helix-turn-helix domain
MIQLNSFTIEGQFLLSKIEALHKEVAKLKGTPQKVPNKELYDTAELCQIFKIERSTLQRWFVAKKLTPIKIIGRNYVASAELKSKFPLLFFDTV